MTKEKLIETLEFLGRKVSRLEHAKDCETHDQLGVYCTCDKDSAESFLCTLVEDIKKNGVES
jgi:hypothetical protein